MRNALIVLLLFVCQHSRAQFNDSTKHFIKYASTGIINKTNSGSSYILSNALNYISQKKNIALNTSAGWVYGINQGSLSNNDLAVHADLNFFKPNQKLYYWALTNFDKTYSLKINYRWQAGAGLSYNFIDSPYLRINVSDGFLFEQADIQEGNTLHKTNTTPRNSFRLLYKWNVKDRFSISGIHFYQPSLLSINDYVIQSSSTVSARIYKWISFNASLVYNKFTATNRETLLFTYGLALEKYF